MWLDLAAAPALKDRAAMTLNLPFPTLLMRFLTSLLLGSTLSVLAPLAGAADAPAKLKVLLVTGDDVMPAHHWPSVSAATREILEQSGKFEVRVSEDAGILDSAQSLKAYDLVFFAMYNAKTPPVSDAAKENLLNFVKGGKGFAVAHLASASYKDWPEFRKLCGRYWVMGSSGHGPRGKFKVRIAAPDNPIVRGIADFEADDELYAKLQGDVPITVLAEADSDWSKKTEPLAFTLGYGQGRVFHEAFGHDKRALDNPSVRALIVRGCQWAATGKVAD
jgi:type 1 glutamine amidotransferase